MSIVLPLKQKIDQLLTSDKKLMLSIRGKIGQNTSIELMKLLKSIDDDPDSTDIFFSFHHKFSNPRDYLIEIINDIKEEYETEKDSLEEFKDLKNLFVNMINIKSENDDEYYTGFSKFAKDFSELLSQYCRNIVFLLDPIKINNLEKFDEMLYKILQIRSKNIKWILYQDLEIAIKMTSLHNENLILYFEIPSSSEKMISHVEKSLLNPNLDLEEAARLNYILGTLYSNKNDINKALSSYHRSLNYFYGVKDTENISVVLMDIAFMFYSQNKIDKAIEYYKKCLDFCNENKLYPIGIFCSNQIGKIKSEENKKDDAIKYYTKSLELSSLINDQTNRANILNKMGELELNDGYYLVSLNNFEEALNIYRKIAHHYGESSVLKNMSKAHKKLGDNDKSNEYLELSKKIQIEKGFTLDPNEKT